MNRCQEIQGHLDDWLDDLLEPAEQERVAVHLQNCAACRRVFERHNTISENLQILGQFADRMTAVPREAARPQRRWQRIGRVAAAVLIVGTIGMGAVWYRNAGRLMLTPPSLSVSSGEAGVSRSLPEESPTANEAPSEFSVTVDDSYMAVRLESSNPRIQIVWLYPMVQPAEPEGDDGDGDANDTSS